MAITFDNLLPVSRTENSWSNFNKALCDVSKKFLKIFTIRLEILQSHMKENFALVKSNLEEPENEYLNLGKTRSIYQLF